MYPPKRGCFVLPGSQTQLRTGSVGGQWVPWPGRGHPQRVPTAAGCRELCTCLASSQAPGRVPHSLCMAWHSMIFAQYSTAHHGTAFALHGVTPACKCPAASNWLQGHLYPRHRGTERVQHQQDSVQLGWGAQLQPHGQAAPQQQWGSHVSRERLGREGCSGVRGETSSFPVKLSQHIVQVLTEM